MINFFFYITLFILSVITINAQDNSFTIVGKVVDEDLIPIPDVQIKSKKEQNEKRTASDGSFSFNYSYTDDYYVIFNHVGYVTDTIFFSKNKALKWAKKQEMKLTIQLTQLTFEDVVVFANKVDTVFGNDRFSIQDYLLLKNDQLLLLTYNKSLRKDGKLVLTDNEQQIVSEYTIPDESQYLYTSYSGDHFLVCNFKIYLIAIRRQEIKLTIVSKEDFYGFHQRIIDTINDQYYYSNFAENYPSVDFLVTSRLDSTHHKIKSVQDDFMMELYRAQYKYVSGREKLWAIRKEDKTGIDKEIWIGAASFTQDILYRPVYAPLFIKNDTIIIFDQYKNLIFKLDSDHDITDSIPFQLKLKGSKEKWEQPLIKDKKTNEIYALYNKGGYNYLKRLNLNNGETLQTLKLNNRYVEQLTIKNGFVYYIYRPFESLQKKFLYREKIIK